MDYQVQEEIERYLRGRMSADEKNTFENRLRTDAALADEVQRTSTAEEAILLHSDDLLKEALTEKGRSMLADWKRQRFQKTALITAAAVALALFLYFLLREKPPEAEPKPTKTETPMPVNPPRPQALYESFYKPTNISGTLGTAADEAARLWNAARTAYNGGRWQEAIEKSAPILKDKDYSNSANFVTGAAMLELGRYRDAAPFLEAVGKDSQRFYQPARWYLALACLRLEDMEKAKTLLQAIRDEAPDPYRTDAAAILEQLE